MASKTKEGGVLGRSMCSFIHLLFFYINICIVTNHPTKFFVVDQRRFFSERGLRFISDAAPTIYLYHHLYRRPFTNSPRCNHFAYMREVEKEHIGDDVGVYYGAATTPNDPTEETAPNQENNKKRKQSSIGRKEVKSRAKELKGTILGCWNIEINLERKDELNMLVHKYKEESMQTQKEILGMKDEVESPVDFVNDNWISGTNLLKVGKVKK